MAESNTPHVHYAPMFRDLAGRAITFPMMQGEGGDVQSPMALGQHITRDRRMGLVLIGLATFPCTGQPQEWRSDGSHPVLGYYVIMASGVQEVDVIIAGRC